MENLQKLIENSTHQITDENLNNWKVIETSDLEEIMQAYHQAKLKLLGLQNVSVSVADVRQAFADYYKTEGCSCCRDTDNHDKAENKLAELLKPDKYDDGSGFDWYKYATER